MERHRRTIMQIELAIRSGNLIYFQIGEQIKRLKDSRELKPGDQLPTVGQIATDERVNFNTIVRAYRLLDEAGFISTQHGRGTYILGPVENGNADHLRRDSLEGLTRRFLKDAGMLECSLEEIDGMVNGQIDLK
jgi:GntR family transcriptional regulator